MFTNFSFLLEDGVEIEEEVDGGEVELLEPDSQFIDRLSNIKQIIMCTFKNPKNLDTPKIAVIILKFEQCGFNIE